MAKRYVVTAPLVVVRDTAGVDQYVYQGREITFDVDAERIEQLVGKGMLEEVPTEDAQAEGFDGPPAKSATKDVWVAYAVSVGFAEDEAKAMKKPELVAAVLGEDPGDDEGDADADADGS